MPTHRKGQGGYRSGHAMTYHEGAVGGFEDRCNVLRRIFPGQHPINTTYYRVTIL